MHCYAPGCHLKFIRLLLIVSEEILPAWLITSLSLVVLGTRVSSGIVPR